MIRPKVRLLAVVTVLTGVLLSAGAGLSVADEGSDKGHGGGSSSSNAHSNSGKPENSGNKPPSASAGGGSNGKNNEGSGSDKSSKPANSNAGGSSEDHSSQTASKTKPDSNGNGNGNSGSNSNSKSSSNAGGNGKANSGGGESEDGSGNANGNSSSSSNAGGNGNGNSSGNGNGNGNSNGNGNGSSGDDSSSDTTQTPSTPTASSTDQTSDATAAGTPDTVSSTPNKNNYPLPALAPVGGPSATAQPTHAPAAASVTGLDGEGQTSSTTPLNSDATAPVPAERPGDVAALSSARVWLTKVSDQFITSVTKALREVTLKDLALAALPGIAGLLFVFMTGIGLGHRQAKFGFIMQRTGALRFVAGGPLGVVRSGGLVGLRATRTGRGRAASRQTPPHLSLVENAA